MKQLKLSAAVAVLMLAGASLISDAQEARSPTPKAPVPRDATEQAAFDVMAKIGWGTNAATRELDEDLWNVINRANLGLIWSRPGLSLRDRELVVMSVLVAVGSPGISHLMEHASDVGITDAEIKELILQTIPYAGQPNAIQAMVALKRMQAERRPKP